MPITRSAKKAHRSSITKRAFNARRKTAAEKAVKTLKKLVTQGKKKEAEAHMRAVQKMLDKAAKGNTLSRGTVARKKSRLAKLVGKLEK